MYTAKLAIHYFNRNPEGSDRCLIMTASLAGYLDQPGSPQYCSSKWGVRGIMRSLRRTMPGMGMRVNIIAPWFVATPIMSDQVKQLVRDRGITFADKEDAGAAVLHIASDKSINGNMASLFLFSIHVVLTAFLGRSLCILPRDVAPQGYRDLQRDDNAEGDIMTDWQNTVMGASHRIGTK